MPLIKIEEFCRETILVFPHSWKRLLLLSPTGEELGNRFLINWEQLGPSMGQWH